MFRASRIFESDMHQNIPKKEHITIHLESFVMKNSKAHSTIRTVIRGKDVQFMYLSTVDAYLPKSTPDVKNTPNFTTLHSDQKVPASTNI